MVEQQSTFGRRVLHVAPAGHSPAERMSEALGEAGCEVIACADLYRALARMGRNQGGQLCAVVVCLDPTDAAQPEFLQLAARHHRRVPVYVYAESHARSKIDLALRLGAKDTIRPETANRVLPYSAPAPTAAPNESASVESQAAGPTAQRPADEPAESMVPARSDGDREEQPDAEMEEPAGPARVPWLRYDGGPKRTPPQPTPARARRLEPTEDKMEPEPLLTPEELQALIGNDEAGGPVNGRGKRGRRR